jgi:hypothetical protein
LSLPLGFAFLFLPIKLIVRSASGAFNRCLWCLRNDRGWLRLKEIFALEFLLIAPPASRIGVATMPGAGFLFVSGLVS